MTYLFILAPLKFLCKATLVIILAYLALIVHVSMWKWFSETVLPLTNHCCWRQARCSGRRPPPPAPHWSQPSSPPRPGASGRGTTGVHHLDYVVQFCFMQVFHMSTMMTNVIHSIKATASNALDRQRKMQFHLQQHQLPPPEPLAPLCCSSQHPQEASGTLRWRTMLLRYTSVHFGNVLVLWYSAFAG